MSAASAAKNARADGHVGVVIARQSTDVASRLAGRIDAVAVNIGDEVAAGHIIASLDAGQLRHELDMARAAVGSARAQLQAARVELRDKELGWRRERELFARGVTSQSQSESAELAHEKALAARERAESELAEQAARVAHLNKLIDDTRITAPYGGTIAMRYVDVGAVVAPGARIARILAGGGLWVRFAAPAPGGFAMRAGDHVMVDIEGWPEPVEGVIRHVAPEIEPASQMIVAEAELVMEPESHVTIRAGQAARVRCAPAGEEYGGLDARELDP